MGMGWQNQKRANRKLKKKGIDKDKPKKKQKTRKK